MTEEIDDTPLETLTALLKGQRRRWRRWFGALLVIVILGGLNQIRTQHIASEAQHAATEAQHAGDTANRAAAVLLAQRTEARINTCLKDKKFADAHDNLVLYFAHIPPSPDEVRTETQRAQRAALVLDFESKNLVPVPDCSPAGIAAFYGGAGGTTTVNPETPAAPTTVKPAPRTTTTTKPTTTTSRSTTTTVKSTTTQPPTTTCMVTIPGVIACL